MAKGCRRGVSVRWGVGGRRAAVETIDLASPALEEGAIIRIHAVPTAVVLVESQRVADMNAVRAFPRAGRHVGLPPGPVVGLPAAEPGGQRRGGARPIHSMIAVDQHRFLGGLEHLDQPQQFFAGHQLVRAKREVDHFRSQRGNDRLLLGGSRGGRAAQTHDRFQSVPWNPGTQPLVRGLAGAIDALRHDLVKVAGGNHHSVEAPRNAEGQQQKEP